MKITGLIVFVKLISVTSGVAALRGVANMNNHTASSRDPLATPRRTQQQGGVLDLLVYNVAGLPDFLTSAVKPRAPKTEMIGQRLSPYTVVHVQEDFNYHAYLYRTDTHPFRTSTSGGVPFGSGLNTLSWLPFENFERVKWNSCQFDSGDCFTPKGFTFMKVKLADGLFVDFYNLHANAGDSAGDLDSRRKNLNQLTDFIRSRSGGNAVVVMGDTNTRYTRSGDNIAQFVADNGLTDAWVAVKRGGNAPAIGSPTLQCANVSPGDDCEVVDKVLFRSGNSVQLSAISFGNRDADFRDGGQPLSDHFPIEVKLFWKTNKNTKWQCILDNKAVGDIGIWWGHDAGTAAWACNEWNNNCGGRCSAAKITEWLCFADNKGKVGNIGIWWENTAGTATWACNEWNSNCGGQCYAGSAWTCKLNGQPVGTVEIWWENTAGAATWACNAWNAACNNGCSVSGGPFNID